MQPRRLGPYEVLDLLGQGGMGQVYRARHAELGVVRAVKVLRGLDPAGMRRFEREATSLAAINHPHVVRIHELAQAEGQLWFSMELIEGESLARVLTRGRPPVERALAIARGVCEGLAVLHDAGIVHRDLKPGNVMIRPDGTPVILDLGLAWRDDERLTQSGKAVGTLPYMAPEQIRGGAIGPATDVHAAGLLLFELLTGRPARVVDPKQPPPAQIRRVLAARVPAPSRFGADVPRAYDGICARATHPDPARRYADARDLLRALRHPQQAGAAPRSGASWQLGVACAALFALGVGGLTYGLARRRFAGAPPAAPTAAPEPGDAPPPTTASALRALLQERKHEALLREATRWLATQSEDDPDRAEVADLAWRARRHQSWTLDVGPASTRVAFADETHLVTARQADETLIVAYYALLPDRCERLREWRLPDGGDPCLRATARSIAVGGLQHAWVLDPELDAPVLELEDCRVYGLAYSPDANHLALVGLRRTMGAAAVIDLASGQELALLVDPEASFRAVTFADDDTILMARLLRTRRPEQSSVLSRWSWASDELIEWPRREPIACLSTYAPEVWIRGCASGEVFVSQDDFVRDALLEGQEARPFGAFQTMRTSHRGGVLWVESAPALGWVFSGSFDIGAVQANEVRVWEPLTGREVQRLADLPATLTGLAVSPEATRFAIACGRQVQVWPLQPDPPTADSRSQ